MTTNAIEELVDAVACVARGVTLLADPTPDVSRANRLAHEALNLLAEVQHHPTPCAAPVAHGQRFLIWSHEHHAWWAPGGNGYTFSREEAGRYDLDTAFGIVRSANAACKPGVVEESLVPE